MPEFMTFLSELIKLQGFWITASGATAGALVGATVSSYFSYRIQRQTLREEEKIRTAEHMRSRQALGRSLIIKLGKIYSNIFTVHCHIEDTYQQLEKSPGKMTPWNSLLPLAFAPETVHFSSDELGMLMSLGDDNLFGLVLNMDSVRNNLLDAMTVYGVQRKELLDGLPVSFTEGTVMDAYLDSNDLTPALKAQMKALDKFIDQMRSNARRGVSESKQALTDLTKQLHDKLDLQHKVEFIRPATSENSE